jgi:hypothetical protein
MPELSPQGEEFIVGKEVVDSLARELLIIITDYYQSENEAKGGEEQTI